MFGFLELVQFYDVWVIHFFENLCLLYCDKNVIFHRFYCHYLLTGDVFGQVDRTEVAITDFGRDLILFLNLTRHFYCYLYFLLFIQLNPLPYRL